MSNNLLKVTQRVWHGTTVQIQTVWCQNHNHYAMSERIKRMTLKLQNESKEVASFLLPIMHHNGLVR